MSIDSSEDFCSCYPEMRTMGRLLNWGLAGSNEANAKVVPYNLSHLGPCFAEPPKGIMFVASKDIAPLDEICYDYGDDICRELFGKRKYKKTNKEISKISKKSHEDEAALPVDNEDEAALPVDNEDEAASPVNNENEPPSQR